MGRIEVHVTYEEYRQASLNTRPGTTEQQILMRLFEAKGIRMMTDSFDAAPPVQFLDDVKNKRFVIRQEQ